MPTIFSGPALGQTTMSKSVPVTVASDQAAMPVNVGNTTAAPVPTNPRLLTTTDVVSIGNTSITPVPVAGGYHEVAGLSAAANGDYLASLDVSQYREATIQVTGTWSGTLTFQGCNDNTNWLTLNAIPVANQLYTGTQGTTTGNGIFRIPLGFRYFRIEMSGYASGIATGVAEFYPFTVNQLNMQVQTSLGYGASHVGSVYIEGSAGFAGAATQGVTTVAAKLNGGTSLSCSEVYLQNDPASTNNLLVGSLAAQPLVLTPGSTLVTPIKVNDVSLIYVKTAAGTATANWLARA